MIVDLGCPNSVLGVQDVEEFIKCLSQFQQEHMKFMHVDEKFKFGPSGPYKCSRKMKIPIGSDKSTFWVTVAIVDAMALFLRIKEGPGEPWDESFVWRPGILHIS